MMSFFNDQNHSKHHNDPGHVDCLRMKVQFDCQHVLLQD